MGLACGSSIYNSLYRGANLRDLRWALVAEAPARSAPLAVLLEAQPPDSKITSHALYRAPLHRLQTPHAPQFFGFSPFPAPFLKFFFAPTARQRPPCAESPRRTRYQTKNPGIPRQNAPFAPRRRPKIPPAKHPSRALKHPPLTPLRIKKLSKVRSTLLTPLPGECILEYMRLKEAAQTTPHGAARAAPTASKTFKLSRLALEEAGH